MPWWMRNFAFAPPGEGEGDDDFGLGEPEDEGEDKEQKPAGEAGQQPEPWKQAIEDQQRRFEEFQNRTFSILSELASRSGQAPPVVTPPAGNGGEHEPITGDQWEAAVKNLPGAIPALIRQDLQPDLKSMEQRVTDQIFDKLNRQSAGTKLNQILDGHYSDDISDPQSPILRSAQAIKEILSPLMDPAERGGPRHNALAYLIAAADNPQHVAKRELGRMKLHEERQKKQAQRLSSLAGIGTSGRGPSDEKPEITDRDEELAERLGIDLKDAKRRERILQGKRTEKLRGVGTQQFR